MIPDRDLRELYHGALTSRSAGDRARCPTPDALDALVERRGDETERLATLDHAMSCTACRREFELLRAIRTVREGNAHAGRARFPVSRRTWMLAAAVLVVAVGGLTVARRGGNENMLRGARGDLVPVGVVGGALVWHPVPGAVRYDVEVLDAAGSVVFHRQTTDTSVVIPSHASGSWWVRATLGDGTERRSAIMSLHQG